MSDFEYKIPEKYEDAVKRKEEVLTLINAYNEALLLEKELPCSEEEIERLQEEYQILNDNLALTEEERLQKLNKSDLTVNEEGAVVEKMSVWDKIHWTVYLYGFLSTIFATGILAKPIGNGCMRSFMTSYFERMYSVKKVGMYGLLTSDYMMSGFSFWAKCLFSYLWLPVLIIILSTVVYLIFRKRNDINTKITKWLLIIHCVLLVVVVCVMLILKEFQGWGEFFTYLDQHYAIFYYTKQSSAGY